MISCDIFNQCI